MNAQQWVDFGQKMEVLLKRKDTANLTVIANGMGKFVAVNVSVTDPTRSIQSIQLASLVPKSDWKTTPLSAINVWYNAIPATDMDVVDAIDGSVFMKQSHVKPVPAVGPIRIVYSAARA